LAKSAADSPAAYFRIAIISAVAISTVLGTISIFIPPSMYSDSGWGFLAWRGTLLGHFNCLLLPDPANISTDLPTFYTAQSPGQYLLPGIISLAGVKLGVAITLTSTLSLLLCLVGWAKIFQKYLPNSKSVILAVVAVGAFRYSTLPFGIYNGGDVLLQAATPWIVLGTFEVPYLPPARAGLLSGALVFIAFLIKQTGLIVVGVGLIAGGIVALRRSRGIRSGVLGGAIAALVVVGAIHEFFISRGWSPIPMGWAPSQASNWSFPVTAIFVSVVEPLVAGISWTDLLAWIFLHPGRELMEENWSIMVCLMLPSALIVASLLLLWQPQTEKVSDLRTFVFWFYGVTFAVFVLLHVHGAHLGYNERHFRSAGTLLFVGALIGSMGPRVPSWMKYSFIALIAFMAVYGIASFSFRAYTAADGHALDRTSWTNQPLFDQSAIRYLQDEYLHEGRKALFVVPSPDIAVTMPLGARVLEPETGGNPAPIDYLREAEIAGMRFRGRVPGHIFVLLPNRIVDSGKGETLLRTFVDYDPNGWQRKLFSSSIVFIQ
jgi:hypothetical protein